MAFIEWTDELSVGIGTVDGQHKVLIGYINELEEAIAGGTAREVVGLILNGLSSYTRAHFMYEEMLFDLHGYPETEGHKAAHGKLFDRVGEYRDRFTGGEGDIGPELLEFLKAWLNKHILKEDMAYSGYLLGKGVT